MLIFIEAVTEKTLPSTVTFTASRGRAFLGWQLHSSRCMLLPTIKTNRMTCSFFLMRLHTICLYCCLQLIKDDESRLSESLIILQVALEGGISRGRCLWMDWEGGMRLWAGGDMVPWLATRWIRCGEHYRCPIHFIVGSTLALTRLTSLLNPKWNIRICRRSYIFPFFFRPMLTSHLATLDLYVLNRIA